MLRDYVAESRRYSIYLLYLYKSTNTDAQGTGRWIVLKLHSSLPIEEQDRVFDLAPGTQFT
jgi:HrpA-like RNA helicase